MMFGVERGLLRISFQVFLTGQLFEDLQAADWVKLGWQQKSEETLFCQKTQMIKSLRWCYFMVCIHRGDLPKSFSCSHSMVGVLLLRPTWGIIAWETVWVKILNIDQLMQRVGYW